LHLIEPLGFAPDDTKLRRAGLDYRDWTSVQRWPTLEAFVEGIDFTTLYAFSTHHTRFHTAVSYAAGDALLFGPETRGLPAPVRQGVPEAQRLALPMAPGNRSLNLSNAVAVAVYEAWRQLEFRGAK